MSKKVEFIDSEYKICFICGDNFYKTKEIIYNEKKYDICEDEKGNDKEIKLLIFAELEHQKKYEEMEKIKILIKYINES